MKRLYLSILICTISLFAMAQDFKFALITDLHIRPDRKEAIEDLQRAIDEINNTEGLSFVIVAGDNTESGDKKSLELVKKMLGTLKVDYHVVSGNHETKWSESGATDFAHIFGSERFKFEHNGIQFYGFGTGPVIRMMDGHIAPQDILWLKEELDKNPTKPTVIITHYPLLPKDVDNWYVATDLLRNYNIKAILGGHYHKNSLSFYGGIPAFINRSTLRDKEDGIGGYSLYTITSDSILVATKKIGQEASQWGGYSLKEKYYTSDNSSYERPDYSVNTTYSGVKKVWEVNIPNAIYAHPLVFADKIYVGDDLGVFYCLSAKDGKELWRFETGNRIVGTADANKKAVVFGSADNYIYALDPVKGTLLWKYEAGKPVLGAATISKDVVYIGASDGCFRALDIKTGNLIWEYTKIKGYIESKPLVYDNNVIFGAWDNTMYALDKNRGYLSWKWDGDVKGMLYSPAAVWPVASQSKVFFTAPDRKITAINALTGTTVWRSDKSMVRETIGLSEDGFRVYSKTMQDSVVCYNATTDYEQRLWSTDVGYGYDHAASMLVEKKGVVFGSTKNGIIFAIDGLTGKLDWVHKVGNCLVGTVHPLTEKRVVYTTSEGIIGVLENKMEKSKQKQ